MVKGLLKFIKPNKVQYIDCRPPFAVHWKANKLYFSRWSRTNMFLTRFESLVRNILLFLMVLCRGNGHESSQGNDWGKSCSTILVAGDPKISMQLWYLSSVRMTVNDTNKCYFQWSQVQKARIGTFMTAYITRKNDVILWKWTLTLTC